MVYFLKSCDWVPLMRIFIDCTHTYTNCMNTGIERVVRNIANHCAATGKALGITCQPVILVNGHYTPIATIEYGRHNREYNRHELDQLLRFEGYEPTACFTADVHANNAQAFCAVEKIADLLKYREHDLGQYIFIKAIARHGEQNTKKPGWLYRSYPEGELI